MIYDHKLALSRGLILGHSVVHIHGHNDDVDVGTEDINESGGDLAYLSAAETMLIASTSASDASAGTGVRSLRINGIDASGATLSEDITLNGTSSVTTVASFLRVNDLISLTAGSAGSNVGDITCTASTAATVQNQIAVGKGIDQNSSYTVTTGCKLYVYLLEWNAAKLSGGGTPRILMTWRCRTSGSAPWRQLFSKHLDTGVTDELDARFPQPIEISGGSDLRFSATTDTANSEAHVRAHAVLIVDGSGTQASDG